MTAKRAIFSINEAVLEGFNRTVPIRERSKLVESFMRKHVLSAEGRLAEAAKAIEADPDYADVLADAAATGTETLARLLRDE